MTLLRSALYQLILVAVVIPYSGLVLCTAPLPRLVRWRVIAGWPQFAFWLSRHLLRIDYEVHGREHIPAKPCVVVSKHQSAWETIAYTTIFPPHVYVLKRELLWRRRRKDRGRLGPRSATPRSSAPRAVTSSTGPCSSARIRR